MSGLFLTFVNMSISASWLILAVLVLRLFLKKAPKWINVVLWGFVALRLIFPFSIESVMSLIPSAETITMAPDTHRPHFESGFTAVDDQVNSYLGDHYFEGVTRPTGHFVDVTTILGIIWIVGISAMLLYTLISFLRLKNKIGTAVLLKNNVFQSENVGSPFVIGIIKPKIYLPFNIGIQDMVHVIAHENAHIRRKDHLWKPLGFLILAIHWFNPLVWLGYVLLCRDIELACDEKVIRELDDEQKADYSQALLTCSVNRRVIAACPLAFGEVGVKKRVKSVLKYKKPALIIVIAAVIVSIIAAVCFLTNPRTTIDKELSAFIDMQIVEHNTQIGEDFIVAHHEVLGTKKFFNKTTVYMWAAYRDYSFVNGEIIEENGSHIPTVVTVKRSGKHGHYELVEYWEPEDGIYNMESKLAKFPWYLYNKVFDEDKYIKTSSEFCQKAAEEFFASETNKENSSGFGVSKEYSKNGDWLACETINEGGKPKKSTHFDPTGTKVAEVNYDSDGNKTYTYFYENGSVAPARTYDISWYENGTYQYRRFYYRDDGKPVQVKIYGANESLIGYRMYSDKGELIEEKGFDSETGAENYCMKYKYKYRADGTVSEILLYDAREGNGKNGTYLETRFVNEEGKVYRATYYDGFSEEYSEPLIGAAIYYEQYETFYDEY